MKLTCTGRKVSLKEAFLQRAQTKLAKLDKFFSPQAQAQVTVTVEKGWQTVELTVKDKGYTCRAEKSADRMEDALDAAYDLLERRIVKNRKRLSDRLAQPAMVNFEAQTPTDAGEEEAYVPVREKHFSVKPVTVEEAILEVDRYLDTAFLSGLHEISIIHGKGTGALRAGLHDYLKRNKHVKTFRLGAFGEGEAGVTVVTLK